MQQRKVRNIAERTAIVDDIMSKYKSAVSLNPKFASDIEAFLNNETSYCFSGSFAVGEVTVSYELPGKRISKHVVNVVKNRESTPIETPIETPSAASTRVSSTPKSAVTNRIL